MPRIKHFAIVIAAGYVAILFCPVNVRVVAAHPPAQQSTDAPRTYLGFDVNEYPGDAVIPTLKQHFAFSGYWLNVPPGAKENNWIGKRIGLLRAGFGFLVLFNGRLERELISPAHAVELATIDAQSATTAAQREGFPAGTIIFLDQEEGGRLIAAQMAYVLAWVEAVNTHGFRAGVYCSGMPAKEGKATIITANDIHAHEGVREITFFVYNDACPPAPGCALSKNPPPPAKSGVTFATVWQFAQSPRRREFTKSCSATYNPDGNCYPPPISATTVTTSKSSPIFLDLDSATSPDPSNGR